MAVVEPSSGDVGPPTGIGEAGRASAAQNAPRNPPGPHVKGPPAPKSADDARNLEEQPGPGPRTPFAQLDLSDYSSLARKIIDLARRYALTGRGSGFASSRSLLVAMLYIGKSESRPSSVSWLWHSLRPHHEALEQSAAAYYPEMSGLSLNKRPGSTPQAAADDMTSDLDTIFADAHRMARQSRETVVSARHLVGSLILPRLEEPTSAERMLTEAGADLSRLRLEFVGAMQRWDLGDDIRAWRDVLRVSEGQADRLLAGYTSDAVAGDDLIGITREVEGLASLAAAWTVEPPLSIGLFGEWGSGKSFFMQKMKERVRHIAEQARRSEMSQKQFGYYKNIVQVEFNAWHYVEGNLWASLVEHIFQNLRVFDTDAEAEIEGRLRKYVGQLHTQKVTTADAQKAEAELRKDHREKKQQHENLVLEQQALAGQAQKARDEAAVRAVEKARVSALDVAREVYESDGVRAAAKDLLANLGIKGEQLETGAQVRTAVAEAAGSWVAVRKAWSDFRASGGKWTLLLWVLAAPAAVLVLGLLASQAGVWADSRPVQTVTAFLTTVGTIVAAGIGLWRKAKPHVDAAVAAAASLRDKQWALEKRVREEEIARDEKVAGLDDQVAQKRDEAAAAELQAKAKEMDARRAADEADAARKKIEDIQKQIDDLRPERMIASLIQDRAAAEDYRKHLGVPALIRRDFERLSGLFRAQREVEERDEDGLDSEKEPVVPDPRTGPDGKDLPQPKRNDPTVINRIVLYVDDLDRCPPSKVVEVLRAIHLLLAFPLFVVVVAVDARWVRRSLKDQFRLLLASSDDTADKERATQDGRPREDAAEAFRRASTDDYLEKIFQVAFWLRPLGDTGCRDLVMNLVPSTKPPGPNGDAQGGPGATNAEPGAIARDGGASPGPGSGLPGGSGGSGLPGGSGGARPPGLPTTPPFHRPPPPRPAWTPVTAQPKTLQITEAERDYMLTLAPIIGRSPRAVKRFINCYRLAKAMLDPGTLESFAPGLPGSSESRATMFLLAAVCGAPEVATPLLDVLERTSAGTPEDWLEELRQAPPAHPDWPRIETALESLISFPHFRGMNALKDAAQRVDRFAFTPTRARPDSSRREPAPATTAH